MQKKNKNLKNKVIITVGIVTIIVLISIIVIQNVIINNGIEENNYLASGNSNSELLAEYIKKGITIGGVTGTLESIDTSDATATEEDILSGKTAYAKGKKIIGSLNTYKITTGSVKFGNYGINSVDIDCGFKADYVMCWGLNNEGDHYIACVYSDGKGYGVINDENSGFSSSYKSSQSLITPTSTGFTIKSLYFFTGYNSSYEITLKYTAIGK